MDFKGAFTGDCDEAIKECAEDRRPVAVFVFDDRIEPVYEYVPQHVAFSQPGLRMICSYTSWLQMMEDCKAAKEAAS